MKLSFNLFRYLLRSMNLIAFNKNMESNNKWFFLEFLLVNVISTFCRFISLVPFYMYLYNLY